MEGISQKFGCGVDGGKGKHTDEHKKNAEFAVGSTHRHASSAADQWLCLRANSKRQSTFSAANGIVVSSKCLLLIFDEGLDSRRETDLLDRIHKFNIKTRSGLPLVRCRPKKVNASRACMKKVSPMNRALRPAGNTAERAAPVGRVLRHAPPGGQRAAAQRAPVQRAQAASAIPEQQPEPAASREELRGLFHEYHSREREQQFRYLEERLQDAITELKAKVSSQELQIESLQNSVDSERRLSQSAIANLKDLFDGNYRVMSDISEKYEDSHQAFSNDRASFDRRLDFIQQESHESTSQLRTAIIKSQDDDRTNLAESLRALADSIDRKPG